MLTKRIEEDLKVLRRHIDLSNVLIRHSPAGIPKLAHMTGYPMHKVRHSLRVLEREGLVRASQEGAKPTKKLSRAFPVLRSRLENVERRLKQIKKQL